MRFGQYDVAEELGRGGMGIVYRGFDPLIRRDVALKTIRLSDIAHPDERRQMQERLEREAQSAGRLSHPNIVTIYQIGYTELNPGETTAFIAMEYVPGRNLAALLEKIRPANPEPILGLLRQAAGALDYAHRNGVIHRDVKPANFMVTPEGQLKITDFGVAKISSQTMTLTGAVLGSPFYMSPEQIRAEPIDGRTDQYSLAVVAYEIFGGRKPFEAETLSALVYKIAHEEPPRLSLETTVLADRLNPVLLRAMSKQAAQRYASCTELVDALEAALQESAATGGAADQGVAPEPPSPVAHPLAETVPAQASPAAPPLLDTATPAPRASGRGKMGWAAAGVVLGLTGAGYLILERQEPSEPPRVPSVADRAAQPDETNRPAMPAVPEANVGAAAQPPGALPPTMSKAGVTTDASPPPKTATPAAKPAQLTPAPDAVKSATVQPPAAPKPSQVESAPVERAPDVRTAPRVLQQAPASYTDDARRAGIEGIVILSVDIDERGIPRRARVVRSLDPGLDRKAIESLSEWRFAPGTLNGAATPSNVSVEVAFRLIGGPSRKSLSLKKAGEN